MLNAIAGPRATVGNSGTACQTRSTVTSPAMAMMAQPDGDGLADAGAALLRTTLISRLLCCHDSKRYA
jgi:hypothetical protein